MNSRCALHGVEQCPLCTILPKHEPVREPRASQFNIAIGKDGNPLPYSPDEVKLVAAKALDDGELIAVLMRLPSGDLAAQIFGPPSLELIEMLESFVEQYKRGLGLHFGPAKSA
jgi:hypothetical protein